MRENDEGKLIVFEGADLSGKGRQTDKAFSYLYFSSKEGEFVITREPTMHTIEGREIRELLKHLKNPYDAAERLLYLYVEDRRKHLLYTINPNLQRGLHVLQDRYVPSTVAYQGAQGVPIKRIVYVNKGFRIPDLTLLFNLTLAEWEKRLSVDKNHNEVFDKPHKEFTAKLLEIYSMMPEFLPDYNIKMISAVQTPEQIHEQVKVELNKLFD